MATRRYLPQGAGLEDASTIRAAPSGTATWITSRRSTARCH